MPRELPHTPDDEPGEPGVPAPAPRDDASHPGPPSQPPPQPHPQRVLVVPAGTLEFGMYLVIAALGLLFASSLLAFAIFRYTTVDDRHVTVAGQPVTLPGVPFGALHLPWPLWLSSAVILVAGFTIHRALVNVRRERQAPFCRMLVATLLLSGLFILIQTPALISLLMNRDPAFTGTLSALLFFMILLHALHVVGGLIPLLRITLSAHAGRYDHEHYGPVKATVMYWHFLEIVWIVMFIAFQMLR